MKGDILDADRIALCVYRDGTGVTVPVTDYLSLLAEGAPGFSADLSGVCLSVKLNGRELLANELSLGPIEMLVPQLREAADRLSRGRMAVVRSGVLDTTEGMYLVFQPTDTDTSLTVAMTEDVEYSALFPVPPNTSQSERLYAYIEQELVGMRTAAAHYYTLNGQVVPTQWLRENLVREAEAGARLCELMQIPAWPPISGSGESEFTD